MSDALPLPPHPDLEQYEKLAKDFQQACKSGETGAIRGWYAGWAETIAGLQGLDLTAEIRAQIAHQAEQIERRWDKFKKSNERAAQCALADAQFFVAQGHGFSSWPKFTAHLEALARADSPVSAFEAAADAIAGGDLNALKKLLGEHPELVRARSTREHHSTLLHYVSANGIEDFRQKTPKNIVEITKLLLEAGADVNAESTAYGGRSTTLGLAATSWHPQNAGVQIPLMQILIEHGAMIDGPDGGSAINGCLHNGRGEAAEFFAAHGARMDLESAAGVGRLDLVKTFFDEEGRLKPPATEQQLKDGFAWACEFGRTSVVDFLLRTGVDIGTKLRHHGQTGLHWAALGGHVETVKLLLDRGAAIDIKDEGHDGTPLGWAIYGWGNAPKPQYYETVALLTRAGATLDPEWVGERGMQMIRSDPGMVAALASS